MATKKTIRKTPKAPTMPVSLVIENSSVKDKLKQPRVFIPLIVIIIAGLLFYFRGLFVAAFVNGQTITRLQVVAELEKRDGKQVLSQMISEALIMQEAGKRKITVSQQEIDNSAKQIETSLSSQGQNLDQALAVQGLTKNDLYKQLRLQKMIEKMFGSKIKIADQEIADYITKNPGAYPSTMKPEEVNTSVKKQLEQQKLSEAFQTWLASAEKNAKINYFVNY